MAVVIKGSGSIEGSTGLEMGANGTTEIRGQVNVAVGSSVAGVSTATNFAPTTVPTGHRNIMINGSMQVAQRASSSTSAGYQTVDRWKDSITGQDEQPTRAQVTLTSSDTGPWGLGFRNAWQITNGNQTSGAGAGDKYFLEYRVEAQDMANSGWDYTSASSYITLSFWVKSSVAQTFQGYLLTLDGTNYKYPYNTGALSANTWTKITKTIPGNSNLQIDNNKDAGFLILIAPFIGTDFTDSVTDNSWSAYASGARTNASASTWWTTNDSTFAVTGFQLEVGQVATPFEHRSYAEEHLRCARYYQEQQGGSDVFMYAAKAQGTTTADVGVALVVPLRASPTVTCSTHRLFRSDDVGYTASTTAPTVVQWDDSHSIHSATIALNAGGHSSITNNEACIWAPVSSGLLFDSEL